MIEIRGIDPTDETTLRAWWEVGHAASAERPFDPWPDWEVSRRALPTPRTDGTVTLLLAVDTDAGDRPVGSGLVFLFLLDNLHLAQVDVYVAPDVRRRGVGRALLTTCEQRARDAGRTTAISVVFAPGDVDSPGSAFAAAQGYPVASAEERKVVDLAAAVPTWGPLDEQVASALAASDGYTVEVFEGAVPDVWADEMVSLLTDFTAMIPTGELELGESVWTVDRLREAERRRETTGHRAITAVAVAPDGRLCGFTDLRVNRHDPEMALIGGTLVLPEHRGHRLGLAMKLLSHRRLVEVEPACRHVETGNAGVNAPMNAVNELMGYRVVERALDVQRTL